MVAAVGVVVVVGVGGVWGVGVVQVAKAFSVEVVGGKVVAMV